MKYNKNTTKRRIKQTNSKGKKIKNKIGLSGLQIALIAIVVIIVIAGSTALGIVKGIIDSAPDISHMDVIPTGYSTTVLADDGVTQIDTLVGSGANREYVTLDQIPLHMQQAFVAIEDERFYEHNGIDLQGIVRAGVYTVTNMITGEGGMQGASTITQQLIKNNVLTSWTEEEGLLDSLQRKIQEQYLAIKLEDQVQDKDWILENYLNTINLGSNTLGVQSAANKYFGKDVSELTLSESAVIAGITQNPYGYDPIRFPESNAERRVRVLDAMLRQGYIDQTQYDEAIADPVYDRISSYTVENPDSYNTYFVDALIEDVLNDLIEVKGYSESDAYKALYQGGLTIVSTQDVAIQAICDEETNNPDNYPVETEYSFDLTFTVKKADGTTQTYTHQTMLAYYKEVNNNSNYNINYASEEECYEKIKEYQGDVMEEGDEIVEGSESIIITLQPQIAMTVMDQTTGEVKALVGGRGDKVGNRTWNRATDTTRQPGSTFKIIGCYAAALDAGGKTLASVQDDAPYKIQDKEYQNAAKKYYGLTTIREAITKSHNITTLKNLQDIGVSLGYEYALKFGFTTLTDDDKNLGLCLGGLVNGVKNLELTAAYAAIANGGEYMEPIFYTAVYDHEGNLILDNTTQEHHTVISEQTAWLLTDAMQDVMTSGTGTRAHFGTKMAQAAKTGTTTGNRDSVFAGYTPYYTAVIWGGFDDNSIQTNTQAPANIWREAMKRIHADLEAKDFEQPTGITTSEVCKISGLVPLVGTCEKCQKGNAVYEEYFATGTVPVKTCDHHVLLDICSETGKIANANCPTNKIKQKVFIIGADTSTEDKKYIATEKFLSKLCTHQAVVEEEPESEDTTTDDTGIDDTGTDNTDTGDTNTGDTGTGDSGTGDTDTGDTNTGDADTGDAEGTTPTDDSAEQEP